MADILTLQTYKNAKGIATTEYDTQLNALIPMVNGYIEKYCNRVFGTAEYTERKEGVIDSQGAFFFQVSNKPIISVQSIDINFKGVTDALSVDVTRLDIFEKPGYAYYVYNLSPNTIVLREEYRQNFYYDITYSGGETVPPPVTFAAVTMLSDTWEYYNRTNTMLASGTQQVGELKSVKIGDYTETYTTGDSLFKSMHGKDTGIVLTQTVKDLLTPYKAQGQSW